jgi:hypothetical protein
MSKYTAAPQRDSFDDTANYSQAPPSYADEPSSSADAALLGGGAPRSSEDNIPDDFKVCECPLRCGGVANVVVVRWFRLRGDYRYPHGVCEKGVFYSVSQANASPLGGPDFSL